MTETEQQQELLGAHSLDYVEPPADLGLMDRLRLKVGNSVKFGTKACTVALSSNAFVFGLAGDTYADAPPLDQATYDARFAIARPFERCAIESVSDTVVFGSQHRLDVKLKTTENPESTKYRDEQKRYGPVHWAPARVQARMAPPPLEQLADTTYSWEPQEVTQPEEGSVDSLIVHLSSDFKAGDEVAIFIAQEVEVREQKKGFAHRALGIKSCGTVIAKSIGNDLAWEVNPNSLVLVDKVVLDKCIIKKADPTEVACHPTYVDEAKGAL